MTSVGAAAVTSNAHTNVRGGVGAIEAFVSAAANQDAMPLKGKTITSARDAA